MGPPRVLALDPLTGDLLVQNRSLSLYSDAEAMRQDIQSALSVIVGEYFIDLRVGTIDIKTWYEKAPPLALIESAVRAKILSRKGVTGVNYVETELDDSERILIVRWEAVGNEGVLNGEAAF